MMQRSPGLTALFAPVLGGSDHMLDSGQRAARWSGRPSPAHALASHRLGAGPTTAPGQGWALQTVRRGHPGPPSRPGSAVRTSPPPRAGRCRGRGGACLGGGPPTSGSGCFRHPVRPLRKRLRLPRAKGLSEQPGVPAGLRGQRVRCARGVPRGDARTDSLDLPARPPMGGQVSSAGSFRGLPCASKANADWMSALSSRLWDVPLHQLSIPGSHDTMTYCLNKKSPISSQEPRLLQLLRKVLPCVTLPVVLKWSTTQVLSVTEQLDAGVRYLDLRIAHMEEGSERNLHFVHMVYTTALVEDTLTEISEWLEGHPREVVILACRNFEGMTEGLHEYLVGCIKNIFGDMLCPRGEVPTLRQLWSRGQQVILSYEDEAAVSRHVELWPGIPYWWGNKVKPQDLVHYLERMKSCGRPGGLFVAGINLTENLEFILVHPAWSLQKLTLSGLPYLCAWVRAQCPGSAAGCTNIIAGDFIGASGFVSDVIGLNRKLLRG